MRITRRERYKLKRNVTSMPISIATINFKHDVNIAYVIRAAACFGANSVLVIGSIPNRRLLNELSGSMYDYVNVITFSNPSDFLTYTKNNEMVVLSAELPKDCGGKKPTSLFNYRFDFNKKYCIVVGNESFGIPVEIHMNSKLLYIPMMGVGYCINTSQTANVILYEASKQYCVSGLNT